MALNPTKKESSFESKALTELIALSEQNLQGQIVEPLLSCLGFENVRSNAGPDEKGKDLVATKRTEFGRTKLYAIQIKKKRFSGKVDSPESLGSLFLQLIQARDEHVVDPTTNTKRAPDACIFITPYPIAPSVWERFHVLSQELNKQNIEIIDGSNLLDLVRLHLPSFLDYFSMDVRYRYQLEKLLNRIPESTLAFSLQRELELSDIYIDASMDTSGRFFETLATRPAWLQGPKLVIVSPKELKRIAQFGDWFETKIEIVDPPVVYTEREIKKVKELQRNIAKNSAKRVVQINLDSLIGSLQTKARAALTKIGELTSAPKEDYTSIALEFIKTKEKVKSVGEFNLVMDQWISFVALAKPHEWSKPETRISSSVLKDIDCNKYILGVPGAGKTTLLRNLARELSKSSSGALPIFVPLLLLKEATREELIRSCIKQLEDQGYSLGEGKRGTSTFVRKAKRGDFHLYLDGLDEAGSDVLSLLKVITEFANEFPKLRLVLSCRSTLDIPSLEGALELRLTPFSRKQLVQFVARWFNSQPTSASDLNTWLQANEKIAHAATNPLVAALLCSLFHLGAEMPTTEVELYERRFELLLGKWDQAKGICPLSSDLSKRYWRFICELAFNMHERELRLISGTEATAIAENYFSERYHGEAAGLIADCVQRGILEYESLDGLSLGHLTYQEYLAARKLAFENDIALIRRKLGVAWWKNVIRFYVSFKEDISALVRLTVDSDCTARIASELVELCELAPWTDPHLVDELSNLADSIDDYSEYDSIVMKELRKGRSIRDAIRFAGKKLYGRDYRDEFDDRSDEEALAYYDFIRHGRAYG